MKVIAKSQNPITDDACKAATGKTLTEWYAYLDGLADSIKGRRDINNHLYNELKVDAWWCTTIVVEYENSKGLKEKDGLSKGYNICSTKTIAAPVEKVYAAWAGAGELDKWFGSGNKLNLSDGGSFKNAEGAKGTYKRIRENKDLRFSWDSGSAPSLVDVVFTDKGGGKTGLLVNHDRIQTREEADGLRDAWADALNKLKTVVES